MIEKDNLLMTHPELAAEWDFEKNGNLTPERVSKGQVRKVFWKCPQGHLYEARIDHRCSMNSGCPYCANKKILVGENDLQTRYPEIAAEWAYDLNEKAPTEYLPYSNKSVYWQCPICNKNYKRKVIERTRKGFACPDCMKESHTSQQEQALYYYFSQVTEVENRARVFGLEIDIYLPNYQIGIEYNGEYFHHGRKEKDDEKKLLLTKKGVRVILLVCGRERRIEGNTITLETKEWANPTNEELTWGIRTAFELCELMAPDIDIDRDMAEIYNLYIRSIKVNSVAVKRPDLAKEWDFDLNKKLRPEAFAYASNKKVWWKCKTCGNNYQMQIAHRTIGGSGCPYCAGKKIKVGFNDLTTTHPQLVKEWDYEKNSKPPSAYSKGSDFKVYWKCKTCGNGWTATINSRAQGSGCPVCAGRIVIPGYNDFATANPDAAKLWDYNVNTDSPSEYTANSNKVVAWVCDTCGHNWRTSISTITRGRRCPECAKRNRRDSRIQTYVKKNGSFASREPVLLEEWDYEKNAPLKPDEITAKSSRKVWWKCKACGNSWQAVCYSRVAGRNCPKCSKAIKKRIVSKD